MLMDFVEGFSKQLAQKSCQEIEKSVVKRRCEHMYQHVLLHK